MNRGWECGDEFWERHFCTREGPGIWIFLGFFLSLEIFFFGPFNRNCFKFQGFGRGAWKRGELWWNILVGRDQIQLRALLGIPQIPYIRISEYWTIWILEYLDIGIFGYWILQCWSIGILEFLNFRMLEYWNIWILAHSEYMNSWIFGHYSIEILEYWSMWILKYWNIGILEYLNIWIFEYCNIGIVEYWNFGISEF